MAYNGFNALPPVIDLLAFSLFEPVVAVRTVKLDVLVPQVAVMDLELPLHFGHSIVNILAMLSSPLRFSAMLAHHRYLFEARRSDEFVEPHPLERLVRHVEPL